VPQLTWIGEGRVDEGFRGRMEYLKAWEGSARVFGGGRLEWCDY